MRVSRDTRELTAADNGRAVAVGTFDGVHLGHRRVIESALAWGRERRVPVAVLTFDPHPLQVLRPDDCPRLLTSLPVKADLVEALGVDQLVALPFTRELSQLEPERFRDDVLAGAMRARYVSVGENFRFGRGAGGDSELLRASGDFEAAIVPLVQAGGEPVSSTRIRSLLASGDVVRAAELLGAPFRAEGEVVRGNERGRALGMPTANLSLDEALMVPGAGVYAGTALGRPAAINVGTRPTFEQSGPTLVEVHVLDFEGDLYGTTLRVAFLERLRDELRFDSADALVEQMRLDVERVKRVVAASALC